MRLTLRLTFFLAMALFAFVTVASADNDENRHRGRKGKPEKRKPHHVERHHHRYEQERAACYYPKWHPEHRLERRWVYFPRFNIYWDNYRSVYVYLNRGRWVLTSNRPQVIVNVNLPYERYYEVDDDEFEGDDYDRVFIYNSRHRARYGNDD